MRTKKQFLEERYFGIQKFINANEAFDVIKGEWGENNAAIGQANLVVADDESFRDVIYARAAEKYIDYKEGKITKDECNKAIGIGDSNGTISDYLLDFDFILYSKLNGFYYTCRMSFKQDLVYQWNKRQWGYYNELSELYDFKGIAEDVSYKVDEYYLTSSKEDLTNIRNVFCCY